MELIKISLKPQIKKLIIVSTLIIFFTLTVSVVMLFFDQMEIESPPIVPQPVVSRTTAPEPEIDVDLPDPTPIPISSIVEGDEMSILDSALLTHYKNGWSISQRILGDGLVKFTVNIDGGLKDASYIGSI